VEVARKRKIAKNTRVTTYDYFQDIAIAFCDTREIPVSRIREIWAGDDLIYDNAPGTQYESIAIYYGNQTTPDPTIVAKEGSNVPNHKKLCFIVLKRYALTQGGAIPLFRARIAQDENMTVGDAISAIATRQDRMDSSEIDVSKVVECFTGYTTSGAQTGSDLLAPLITTYTLGVQQRGSVLHFFPRGTEIEVPVTIYDLAFVDGDEDKDVSVPFERTDVSDREIPAQITVKFYNPDNNLETGTEPHRRETAVGSGVLTLDTNLSLYREDAQKAARKLIWAAAGERQKVKVVMPPTFAFLLEGHAITFPYGDRTLRVYCTSVTQGANYLVEAEGVISPRSLYDQNGAGTLTDDDDTPYSPPETIGYLMDLPALTDNEITNLTAYFVSCAKDPAAVWQGAVLMQSLDGGVSYEDKGSCATEAQIGFTVASLGDGPSDYWDRANYIDVQFYEERDVEGVTEDECLSGAGRLAIRVGGVNEWEIIGYTDVTQLSEHVLRFSNLLRGLRGTEHLINQHTTIGEPVVVIQDDGSIGGLDFSFALLTAPLHYKFPAVGGHIENYPSQKVAIKGISCRPLSPVYIEGEWDPDTSDVTISWTRRSKQIAYILGPLGMNLSADENPERYEVEIRTGGITSPVIRTFSTSGPAVIYTADEQFADGLTAGSSGFLVTVYQMSTIVGRGQPARKVLIP
jgi:hypothetical protein